LLVFAGYLNLAKQVDNLLEARKSLPRDINSLSIMTTVAIASRTSTERLLMTTLSTPKRRSYHVDYGTI